MQKTTPYEDISVYSGRPQVKRSLTRPESEMIRDELVKRGLVDEGPFPTTRMAEPRRSLLRPAPSRQATVDVLDSSSRRGSIMFTPVDAQRSAPHREDLLLTGVDEGSSVPLAERTRLVGGSRIFEDTEKGARVLKQFLDPTRGKDTASAGGVGGGSGGGGEVSGIGGKGDSLEKVGAVRGSRAGRGTQLEKVGAVRGTSGIGGKGVLYNGRRGCSQSGRGRANQQILGRQGQVHLMVHVVHTIPKPIRGDNVSPVRRLLYPYPRTRTTVSEKSHDSVAVLV